MSLGGIYIYFSSLNTPTVTVHGVMEQPQPTFFNQNSSKQFKSRNVATFTLLLFYWLQFYFL